MKRKKEIIVPTGWRKLEPTETVWVGDKWWDDYFQRFAPVVVTQGHSVAKSFYIREIAWEKKQNES